MLMLRSDSYWYFLIYDTIWPIPVPIHLVISVSDDQVKLFLSRFLAYFDSEYLSIYHTSPQSQKKTRMK